MSGLVNFRCHQLQPILRIKTPFNVKPSIVVSIGKTVLNMICVSQLTPHKAFRFAVLFKIERYSKNSQIGELQKKKVKVSLTSLSCLNVYVFFQVLVDSRETQSQHSCTDAFRPQTLLTGFAGQMGFRNLTSTTTPSPHPFGDKNLYTSSTSKTSRAFDPPINSSHTGCCTTSSTTKKAFLNSFHYHQVSRHILEYL